MKKKSKKQAVLDAKAKADAKWDIWVKTHDTSAHDARDSINQELHDTDSASFQSHCYSCGVPWLDHMGIIGTCAENAKLRKERDEARRMYCVMAANVMYRSENKSTAEHIANQKNWDCYEKDETK